MFALAKPRTFCNWQVFYRTLGRSVSLLTLGLLAAANQLGVLSKSVTLVRAIHPCRA
ncbi:MAG: hypothetical protein OXC19_17260 [Bryobacterales bacterium]|nr:hypothetical protein [Bryobacterales bacterium]